MDLVLFTQEFLPRKTLVAMSQTCAQIILPIYHTTWMYIYHSLHNQRRQPMAKTKQWWRYTNNIHPRSMAEIFLPRRHWLRHMDFREATVSFPLTFVLSRNIVNLTLSSNQYLKRNFNSNHRIHCFHVNHHQFNRHRKDMIEITCTCIYRPLLNVHLP